MGNSLAPSYTVVRNFFLVTIWHAKTSALSFPEARIFLALKLYLKQVSQRQAAWALPTFGRPFRDNSPSSLLLCPFSKGN